MDATYKAAMILADQFEDQEALAPKNYLENNGVSVEVVGMKYGTVRGKRGATIAINKTFSEVNAEDYDLLVIPGGGSPERLRIEEAPLQFVRDFWNLSRPVASICHGPQLLISADLINGVRLTSWPGIRDDVKLAGAIYEDAPVIVDRNLLTSRYPADIPAFNHAALEMLRGKEPVSRKGEEAA